MEKFTINLQIAPELHLSNSRKQEGVACETARMRIMRIFKILASENRRQLQVQLGLSQSQKGKDARSKPPR